MHIELLRSWCFECPEAECDNSAKMEQFRINRKLFAIINQNQITLKCTPQQYAQAINNPSIVPAKKMSRYHWITIQDVTLFSIEDLHEYLITSYELVVQTFSKRIQRRLLEKLTHEIDTPWKDILNTCFNDFIAFFYPEIYNDIDWTKAPLYMDKELSQIIRESKTGSRFVDKLVKVFRKSGEEKWVLVHIEVQGQSQDSLPERMFIYSNRLHDIYQMKIASFAILADNNPNWRPSKYEDELWGSQKIFVFPIVKLLDYKDRWEELKNSDNPFAIVVMAHLKMLETKKNYVDRLYWKLEISKMLYVKGYSEDKILALLRFIDWIMVLPKDMASTYRSTINQTKEEKKMKFITSFELIAMEKGEKKGEKKGKILGKIEALKEMLQLNYLPRSQFEKMLQPLQLELAKMK
jgi:predicted DNA-binding protein (MmcQ/YjbR family)